MKTITALLAVIAIGVLAAVGYAYSGLYDVSATSSHSGILSWLLSTTSHASVERRAGEIDVPDLDDMALTLAGVNDFAGMCAGCHGAPGQAPEAMGQGLNPAPPDLAESAAHMTPAELFWVTKNGLKMTGMPAWGATHDDSALWPVVAFMTRLPGLDGAGYEALLADATGRGHHSDEQGGAGHDDAGLGDAGTEQHANEAADDSAAHDHSGHEHAAPEAPAEEPPHDDGHDHEH